MAGFETIIGKLERQRIAIETALGALRGLDGTAGPAKTAEVVPAAAPGVSSRKGKKLSAAVRRKMALGQRARWAKIHGEIATPAPVTKEAPKPKRTISPEGIERIVQATKRRWARVRAAAKAEKEKAEAKKAARKAVAKAPATKTTKTVARVRMATA